MGTALVPLDPSGPWVTQIQAAWRKSIAAVIETGRLLVEAKAALPHGAFEAMVRAKLPFDASTGRRLMIIAGHPVISNRAHAHALPSSWGTLYELTKLDDGVLAARIQDGTIHPRMERKDVMELRGIKREVTRKPTPPTVVQHYRDPFTTFDAAHADIDTLIARWLSLARAVVESTEAARVTKATAARLIRSLKYAHDFASALEVYGRLSGNVAGECEARKLWHLAELGLGRLLVETGAAGLRITKPESGEQIGHQVGLRLDQFGISRKQSSKWQDLWKSRRRRHARNTPSAAA